MTGCTGPPLLRLTLIRLAIFTLPFVIWWLWRESLRLSGRDLPRWPWAWLVLGGAVLATSTLLIGGALQRGQPGRYVPAEARADGSVAPARYESAKH